MKDTPLYRRLLAYLRPYWLPHFALAIACMLLYSATNGVMPFLLTGSEIAGRPSLGAWATYGLGSLDVFQAAFIESIEKVDERSDQQAQETI